MTTFDPSWKFWTMIAIIVVLIIFVLLIIRALWPSGYYITCIRLRKPS